LSFGCSLCFFQLLLQLLVFLAQSVSFPFQSSSFLFPLPPLLTIAVGIPVGLVPPAQIRTGAR
jgi:hypothetical protein